MAIFALIGAAGFVAPRHMRAVKSVGGVLTAACDPNDSVGILDSYFPDALFFVEFEHFMRHIDELRGTPGQVDYVSICSPNFLHDAHCRFALRSGADAICEKPLVLVPRQIDSLEELEGSTGRRVLTILQLRLHPAIGTLKASMAAAGDRDVAVDLTYITSRGAWYQASWKGDETKSGGIAANIGVHFFDALVYIFGPPTMSIVHLRDRSRAAGFLVCGRASIRWFLSIDRHDLPAAANGRSSYRAITVDGEEIEFSEGFGDLHTRSYEEIVAGRGFGLAEVHPSVEIVSAFRSAPLEPRRGERHPLVGERVDR